MSASPTAEHDEKDKAPVDRYAILREGEKVATVSAIGDGDELQFKVNAQTADVLEQLRGALVRDTKGDETKTEQTKADDLSAAEPRKSQPNRDEIVRAVVSKIESLGFGVQQLPSSDVQVEVEISANTRRRVGVTSQLHEFADPNGMGKVVFDALANVGSTARTEMAQKVTDELAAGNAEGAAKALTEWAGIGLLLGVTEADLGHARRVPVEGFPPTLREEVLSVRLALAGQINDMGAETEKDLRAAIDEFGATMDVAKRAELSGFEGAMARAKGYKATAIRHWKAALKGKDSTRGHALYDLSRAYPKTEPEAARYAELAADASLQAGDQKEAARCLQRLAACLLVRDPKRAVEAIDRALGLLGTNLLDRDWKAGLLHYKAEALDKLGLRKPALDAAAQAADERRDLMGAEVERHSSLALASILAKNAGDNARADELKAEADNLAAAFDDPRARLRHAASEVVLNYDSARAEALRDEAEKLGEMGVAAGLVTMRAVHEGTPEQRLQWLEEALVRLRAAKASRGDTEVVLQALAQELMKQGETDLAIRNYKEVLDINPFNQEARQNAAALLHKSERWQEAVDYFEAQREIFGDKPGLLYGLGKSYLNVGDVNAAATTLMLSKAAIGATENLKEHADKLIQQAIQQGGRPDLTKRVPQPDVVTHAEFEATLNEMAHFFAAEKRMSLWKSLGNNKHEWIERPEARAQDTVTAYLSGSLGKRVEVLEAVAAGAGFVDLYVIGENGFRAIVELKMLGDPYSSTYAFAGENQIAHYMDQKKVAIGYLVIFDARKRDFGKRPDESATPKNKTIRVLLVDVRPDPPSKQH